MFCSTQHWAALKMPPNFFDIWLRRTGCIWWLNYVSLFQKIFLPLYLESKICNNSLDFIMHIENESYGTECPLVMDNVAIKEEIPQWYYTSEEFWHLVRKDVDNICRKYGIL